MKRTCILLLGSLVWLLCACQKEKVVRQSSIARQFSEMNKDGWAVSDNSRPKPAGTAADPNVRVIREADFTGFRFNTNFQVDDPSARQPKQNQPPSASAQPQNPQPGANPWGVAPVTPGH